MNVSTNSTSFLQMCSYGGYGASPKFMILVWRLLHREIHKGPIYMVAPMGPMLSQIGFMWVPYLNPRGTHAKVICKTHVGSIIIAHMGPMLSRIGPMWVQYLNPSGTHNKVICKTHKGPIYGSPYAVADHQRGPGPRAPGGGKFSNKQHL